MSGARRRKNPGARVQGAALEHLTGPSRGAVTWLGGRDMDMVLGADRCLHARETGAGEGEIVACLRVKQGAYGVEAVSGRGLWVNGAPVETRQLADFDIVEFGETGPITRFVQNYEGDPVRKTVGDICRDCGAYLRTSRRPAGRRVFNAAGQFLVALARETTVLFRIGVVVALTVLGLMLYQQYRLSGLLQRQIETSETRLDDFARALTRAREEALTPGDLETLRRELAHGLTTSEDRLTALEQRSQASARVIAAAMSSVVFLQGAYGYRETSSGRMLRHVAGSDGVPLITPTGRPLLTLSGEGPVAERQFTGTAFAVGDGATLLTSRHLALPWEHDADVEAYAKSGLEPVMIRFIAYTAGAAEAADVEMARVSDDADLALLRWTGEAPALTALALADAPPAAGDAVIIMGFPTGLRSMLAQAGEKFVEELQASGKTGFWDVAARLAAAGHIMPLASRGIVGRVSGLSVVYDADTTHGGSGGPVLDVNGRVVAVNAAIVPDYGGSNLGVPAEQARALLDKPGEM